MRKRPLNAIGDKVVDFILSVACNRRRFFGKKLVKQVGTKNKIINDNLSG
jgi:hypothetical protein